MFIIINVLNLNVCRPMYDSGLNNDLNRQKFPCKSHNECFVSYSFIAPCRSACLLNIYIVIQLLRAVFTQGPTWAMARGGTYEGGKFFETGSYCAIS